MLSAVLAGVTGAVAAGAAVAALASPAAGAAPTVAPVTAPAQRPQTLVTTPLPGQPHPHRASWTVTVTVQTVPALPGVRFAFDGVTATTDSYGRASFTQPHNFAQHTLTLVDTSIDTRYRHYRFARWAGQRDPDQAFRSTVVGLPMRADYTVMAAFTARFPVTPSFTDQYGAPVAARDISSVTVKSDTGVSRPIPVGRTVWLDGLLPVFRGSVLTTRPISYRLESVTVDGANTVDAGRQRFTPSVSSRPVFVTQFHDLTVTAHDALFSHRMGTATVVTMPDGTVRTVRFGADGSATLRHLPRGDYLVDVRTNGVTASRRLLLSKDRAVDVQVIGYRDLAIVAAFLLALAGGLAFAGRAAARRTARTATARRQAGKAAGAPAGQPPSATTPEAVGDSAAEGSRHDAEQTSGEAAADASADTAADATDAPGGPADDDGGPADDESGEAARQTAHTTTEETSGEKAVIT